MQTLTEIIAGKLAPYVTARVSPDGQWAVVVATAEMRMTHWVDTAALWQVQPEQCVLELGGSLWSTEGITWSDDSQQFTASLRVYPGRLAGLEAIVDVAARTVTLTWGAHQEVVAFAAVSARLDQYERSGGH